MKKQVLLLAFLLPLFTTAQIIYQEDFESVVVPANPGYTQVPANMTTYNDTNISGFGITDPWVVHEFYPEKAACCPTYFTPFAQADRWLITPAITLTNSNNLIWRSKTYWNQIAETYDVLLSTTGVLKTDFTTVLATIANDSDVYRMHAISLAAWNGQTVHIAFRMRSLGGWYFFMDEIRVEGPATNDAAVIGTDFHAYEAMGNLPVDFLVFNNSANVISSMQLNYDVNGGPVQTQSLSSISINGFDTVLLTHSIPWNPSLTGYYTLRLWTSNINNATDVRPQNDTFMVNVGIVSQLPVKNVMVEEHTGAWCGYCVDGSYHLELLSGTYPWVIPYAIHQGDGMSFPYGDSVNTNVNAYPSGFFDRYPFPEDDGFWGYSDRTEWDAFTNMRHADGAPCAVAINYSFNSTTRVLSATVESTFYGDFTDNLRLNLYIIQDSVSEGTGPMWDQNNYYSSQSSGYGGPSHPYYNLPDPIPGYQHRHVCRAMLGGAWGVANSIPASVTDGGVYSNTFNYTLPANFDTTKITLVGMVQRYDTDFRQRPILNAVAVPLLSPTGITSHENSETISVFPNPANEDIQFQFAGPNQYRTILIYNSTGQNVATYTTNQNTLLISTSEFAEGMYFYSSVDEDDNTASGKFIVAH